MKALVSRAQGEMTIKEAINELKVWGTMSELKLAEVQTGCKTVHVIKDWRELLTTVGDHQSTVAAMKDSPYFASFAAEVS